MLDLALRYSPLISLAAPIVTLALVAWLSRYFVPLRRYERERADLDDRLEVMSEAIEKHDADLRKKPDAATVPIIAVTANAFAEDIDKTTKAGMNGHISKPIDVALLYQALEKCIKHE